MSWDDIKVAEKVYDVPASSELWRDSEVILEMLDGMKRRVMDDRGIIQNDLKLTQSEYDEWLKCCRENWSAFDKVKSKYAELVKDIKWHVEGM